jgi:hypothetical protein
VGKPKILVVEEIVVKCRTEQSKPEFAHYS